MICELNGQCTLWPVYLMVSELNGHCNYWSVQFTLTMIVADSPERYVPDGVKVTLVGDGVGPSSKAPQPY